MQTQQQTGQPDYMRVGALKLGEHRGAPRVWIEGDYLLRAGFAPAQFIEARFRQGRVTLRRAEAGRRRVSQKGNGRPVIDLNSRVLREAFGDAQTLKVVVKPGEITLTPLRSEERRRTRCRNGKEGAVYAGGGLFTKAAQLAGFKPGFAIEINPAYAAVYERNFPDSLMFNMSVADVPLEELPQVELLTIGIPCELFTNIRTIMRDTRAKRDHRELPEAQHIDADLSVWAALIIERVNPATIIIEEAREWIDTGACWLLRHFLTRLGYTVEARVLDAVDYGELMHRRRTVLIATSEERVSWPVPARSRRTLGDIFDTAAEVAGEWFDATSKRWLFEHWRKQGAKGNGFEAVKVTAASTSVKGVTKRYLSGRGDNTVIAHPERSGVFRFFTLAELRRLFALPTDFILPEAKTLAGEVLGQGVIVSLFQRIIECATGRARAAGRTPTQLLTVDADYAGQMALAF